MYFLQYSKDFPFNSFPKVFNSDPQLSSYIFDFPIIFHYKTQLKHIKKNDILK